MTGDHFEAILKTLQAKAEKDGFSSFPDAGTVTLYIAHDGASLTVPRVEALRVEGELLYARTTKGERFALARGDIFAVAQEGGQTTPQRRAGFG